MSYEGYEERICPDGHYYTFGCWVGELECSFCGKPAAFAHSVDVTNGYDEQYPETCRAPKTQIGFGENWKTDRHGNRYDDAIPLFAPGDYWVPRAQPKEPTA